MVAVVAGLKNKSPITYPISPAVGSGGVIGLLPFVFNTVSGAVDIQSNRSNGGTNSAVNPNATGIFSAGNDTSGVNPGATANYTTIGGGDQNQAGAATVSYDLLTGTFQVGESVNDLTSGASAVVASDTGSVLTLAGVTGGTISSGDSLQGVLSGATATATSGIFLDPTVGAYATVAGGLKNSATGYASGVGGGIGNIAAGMGAYVPGGNQNIAAGQNSFAGGNGSFVAPTAIGGFAYGPQASVLSSWGVAFGSCQANSAYAFVAGFNCIAGSIAPPVSGLPPGDVALGRQSVAISVNMGAAFARGIECQARADAAEAAGYQAVATRSTQRAFAGGAISVPGDAQFSDQPFLGTNTGAASNLASGTTPGPFQLQAGKAYLLDISVVAQGQVQNEISIGAVTGPAFAPGDVVTDGTNSATIAPTSAAVGTLTFTGTPTPAPFANGAALTSGPTSTTATSASYADFATFETTVSCSWPGSGPIIFPVAGPPGQIAVTTTTGTAGAQPATGNWLFQALDDGTFTGTLLFQISQAPATAVPVTLHISCVNRYTEVA
jgi:hypothetical protein